jgi:DNA-3-methyladenine glycosylase II
MEQFTFSIRPKGPFRLDLATWALRRQRHNIIDQFDGTIYRRILVIDSDPVLLSVQQKGNASNPVLKAVVQGCPTAVKNKTQIKQIVSRLLGAEIDLAAFYAAAKADPVLDELVEKYKGFKPPQFTGIYEAILNAICFQQLSLHVGVVLMNRLAQVCGKEIETEYGRFFSMPGPEAIIKTTPAKLLELGLSNNKVKALIELADRATSEKDEFGEIAISDDETAIDKLKTFRGIGRWSAEYVLLRGLGRLHIFPGDDVGFQNGLKKWLKLRGRPEPKQARRIVHKWFPFGGLIYFHLLLARLDAEGFLNEKD